MIYVHIDASILALPNLSGTPEEFERIILRVADWSDVSLNSPHVSFVKHGDLYDILDKLSMMPSWHTLNENISFFSLEGIVDANTIISTYAGLMRSLSDSVDDPGIELLSFKSCELDPDLISPVGPAELRDSLLRSTGTALTCTEIGECSGRYFVASSIPEPGPHSVLLKINEPLIISGDQLSQLDPIEGRVAIVDGKGQILDEANPLAIWQSAVDSSDIHFAIAIRAFQILRDSGTASGSKIEIPSFGVGSCFFNSLATAKAKGDQPYAEATLEACARIIAGCPKNRISGFGRPGPKIREDGSVAKRTHVSKRGEAIRLMIWQTKNVTEFANVGVKADLEIEYGDPFGAFHGVL